MKHILENILLSARPKAFAVLCVAVAFIGTAVLSGLWGNTWFGGYMTGMLLFWILVTIEVIKK